MSFAYVGGVLLVMLTGFVLSEIADDGAEMLMVIAGLVSYSAGLYLMISA